MKLKRNLKLKWKNEIFLWKFESKDESTLSIQFLLNQSSHFLLFSEAFQWAKSKKLFLVQEL